MGSNDFVVESEGSCFLCWDTAQRPSKYSLHRLSRYLRMDMKKVFRDDGPIPKPLLDKVEKSKLKAELCKDCANLSETFSVLHRKLEKIQMEMTCCLDSIHGKLEARVEKTGKTKKQCHSENEPWSKLEIAQVLRLEALHKCSRKLSSTAPRIKTKNMTPQEITRNKLKIKASFKKTLDHVMDPTTIKESNFEDPIEMVVDDDDKSELAGFGLNEYGNDYLTNCEAGAEESSQGKDTETTQLSPSIPPEPIKTIGKAGKPQYSLNKMTGKWKCQLCPKEYSSEGSCQKHFNSVHLNIKFKCRLCNKSFSDKSKYQRHYLNSHVGVRFKCTDCDKIFSYKPHLMEHHNSVHLRNRFPCQFCAKTFARSKNRNFHMNKRCRLNPDSPSFIANT